MSVDEYFTEIEFSLLNRVSTAAPFEEKNPPKQTKYTTCTVRTG